MLRKWIGKVSSRRGKRTSRAARKSYRTLRHELLEDRKMLSIVPAVPELHSGDFPKKIFLDFNGHTVTESYWTDPQGDNALIFDGNDGDPIHAPPYDIDGDPTTFSQLELDNIYRAWQEISEDFAPFQVNVTTKEPDAEDFGHTALRVIFSSRYDDENEGGTGDDWIHDQISGIAHPFAWSMGVDVPVWVFANGFHTVNTYWNPIQADMAVVASHEIGHALGTNANDLGLDHDGHPNSPHEEYYIGHGSGETHWSPIMGGAEHGQLSQWSQGDYDGAMNSEDDIAIITSHLGIRDDEDDHEYNDSISVIDAISMPIASGLFSGTGLITTRADVDVFKFDVGSVTKDVTIRVDPAKVAPNLDIKFTLYSASDLVNPVDDPIAPVDQIDATYSFTGQGVYLLVVDGDENRTWGTGGYDDYGSLGHYTISGFLGAPRVLDVIVSSTVANNYGTNLPFEFSSVAGTEEQMRTVPVGGADRLAVRFSEEVDVVQGDLGLIAINRVITEPAISAFVAPDDTNGFTATWTFAAALPAAQYVLRLDDTIEDITSNGLDGEWTNPSSFDLVDFNTNGPSQTTSQFPSGNGTAGGDFQFVFTILPGDGSRDNSVGNADLTLLLNNWGDPNRSFATGDYSGDGIVGNADQTLLLNHWGLAFQNLLLLADYDDNWTIDGDDTTAFMTFYNSQNSAADLNGDSAVNLTDYDAFYALLNFEIDLIVVT